MRQDSYFQIFELFVLWLKQQIFEFFKIPFDKTSTKEWIFHQAGFCSTGGKNTLMVRDGLSNETMGSP